MWKVLPLAALLAAAPAPAHAPAEAAARALAADGPVALVMRVSGGVEVLRNGQAPAPVRVGDGLAPGDRLVPEPGARALLLTRSGATLAVTEPTTLSEPSAGGDPDLFDRAVATLARAASADARTAGGRQGMIRPVPGEPVPVSPRNGLAVSAVRPVFTWLQVDGATGYTLQLRPVDGGVPVRWQVGPDTTWAVPDDADALAAGTTYAWTVAPAGGRPAREQRFRVLGPDETAAVAAGLEELAALGLDPRGDGRLLSAVVYRQAGLVYEAVDALEALEEASAGDFGPELFMLQGEVLNLVGRHDEATAAFDRADALLR